MSFREEVMAHHIRKCPQCHPCKNLTDTLLRPFHCVLANLMLYLCVMTLLENRGKAVAVQTMEEERYRLARWLQKDTANLLANAALEVETCLELMRDKPDATRKGLRALARELRQGLDDLRDVIADLQPPLLSELGLGPSLRKYANDFSRRTGIAVKMKGWKSLDARLPTMVEIAIFRIAQEALENVRDHAQAKRAELILQLASNQIQVTISDDGKGFDAARSVQPGRRLGLAAMRDRAESLGGNLQIFSKPGRGVRVVVTAPLRMQNASQ